MVDTRKLATATLFGVIISIVKGPVLPPPIGDLLVVVEAMLLGLSFILIGRGGATYTEVVAGFLLSVLEPSFIPFSFLLAILYGAQVDIFSTAFKVKSNGNIGRRRLLASITLSSATTGPIAYYTTVSAGLVPSSPVAFYLFLIVFGVVSGAAGAYLAVKLWNRNLKARFQSEVTNLKTNVS